MSDIAVANAAVDSTKGTIYQLYLAVQKCFELVEGQSVFIEKYGDVTVTNAEQIEVKHYAGPLTDRHENFWKTVRNWMRPEFVSGKYSALILFTTQPIGTNSRLLQWKEANLEKRLALMREILAENEQELAKRVAEHGAKTPPLAVPESLKIQRHVLAQASEARLREVVGKMFITSGSPRMEELFNRMKQQFCKGILVGKQDDVCAALLGYILSPSVVNQQGWKITYEDFAKKVAELHSQYCKETRQFPTKYRRRHNSPEPAVPATRFVNNILEINYTEIISKAVKDYLYASDTVAKDFRAYERPLDNYEIFSEEVFNQFTPLHSTAKRTLAAQVDGAKTFYDQMMLLPVPKFPGFETPDASFRNGVLHMHHDDEAKKLSWKLT